MCNLWKRLLLRRRRYDGSETMRRWYSQHRGRTIQMCSLSKWCILHSLRSRVKYFIHIFRWNRCNNPLERDKLRRVWSSWFLLPTRQYCFENLWRYTFFLNCQYTQPNKIINIFPGWNRAPNQCFRGEFENRLKFKLKIIKKTSKSCLAACLLDKNCSGYHHSGLEDCFLLMMT